MNYKPEPIFDTLVEHGEGSIWIPETQQYYWVDLIQGSYLKGKPTTGKVEKHTIGEPLGVMALTESGQPVMATANGFGLFDESTKKYTRFDPSPESDLPELRFNDGTVDTKGRFYAGTMTYDGSKPIGRLYRLNKDHSFKELDSGLNIPNGMGWNTKGDVFYMIDTLQFKMFAFDYDVETGDIDNKRTFMTFDEKDLADGMTIDTEGCFWIAFYGEGKVIKFDPDGKKLLQIDFPAPYTTSCCFGGADMKQLFITTSRIVMDEKAIAEKPLSGSCFVVETDSVGLADPRVVLD